MTTNGLPFFEDVVADSFLPQAVKINMLTINNVSNFLVIITPVHI
ncbi:Uncharacterised protein [Staphylococcus aureus]|nr:Uncharacterised protein [Staphylococcus aureus]